MPNTPLGMFGLGLGFGSGHGGKVQLRPARPRAGRVRYGNQSLRASR